MDKPKYKLGDKILKYDFESNSVKELMINQIIIEFGSHATLGNKPDEDTKISYRFATKKHSNEYTNIQEWEINKTHYFTSEKLLQEKLLGNTYKLNKLD